MVIALPHTTRSPSPSHSSTAAGSTTTGSPPPSACSTFPSLPPQLLVTLSLPKARYSPGMPGLRVKLTARLAPHIPTPISFIRRGTIFDPHCPLLGHGGFWGIADAGRRPVKFPPSVMPPIEAKKLCLRSHQNAEIAYLGFGRDTWITLHPGEEFTTEVLLPLGADMLMRGESYTVYSRPDREKKKPAKARCRVGTREEVAAGTFWIEELDDQGSQCRDEDGGWCKVDVEYVVRDRGWKEMAVVVANSVGFRVA